MVNKMIPYIAKVNDNKDYLTTGLLLEELNVKEFDKTKASTINVKDIATTDETNFDNIPFMDESRLKEVAKDAIEKYRERSVNLGTTSVIEKSVREAVKNHS